LRLSECQQGRDIVSGELSLAVVIARTFEVYNELRRA